MPIDDLWYLTQRGPDKKRLPSKRHGRGKRWRVRYADAAGEPREKLFERKVDAEAFDLECRSGVAAETKVAKAEQQVTFREYGERWRLSRQIGQALDYQRHTESRLRHHLYPHIGKRQVRTITVTDVLEWVAVLLRNNVAQSSVKTYFDLFNAVMNAAVADKVISDNPCKAVRLSSILRGFSRAPKWVPTDDDMLALVAAVPDRYQAAIWCGAGEGLRLGEVLGLEDGTRCVDRPRQELHVVQQLRFHKAQYGGFYLAPPKAGSVGDVDLDDHVALVLAEHIRKYPPALVDLPDITTGTPDPGKQAMRRAVPLLFTDDEGKPIHDQRWSELWGGWRKAAGWPEKGTFHSLRHYFATRLITSGADPTDVQNALRHSSLRITLETYVHWWPKKNRRRNIVSTALREAAGNRSGAAFPG
ncbi:tyrosine-type recombinase/integrase [Micromonospora carbonacea]|uniref:tyrosine-type recombinase/integrase n=1 Tax=Micromonospora carbonacea TaxID=47853 RepID=UPI003D966D9E